MNRFALARGARRRRKAWGGARLCERNPRIRGIPVAAHEVGDSRFIISDFRRSLYRTLRALELHKGRQLMMNLIRGSFSLSRRHDKLIKLIGHHTYL